MAHVKLDSKFCVTTVQLEEATYMVDNNRCVLLLKILHNLNTLKC